MGFWSGRMGVHALRRDRRGRGGLYQQAGQIGPTSTRLLVHVLRKIASAVHAEDGVRGSTNQQGVEIL